MVDLEENEIVITIPAQVPSQKLAELPIGLIYFLNNYFSHLDNDVHIESGAAYIDLIIFSWAIEPNEEQLERIGNCVQIVWSTLRGSSPIRKAKLLLLLKYGN